LLLERSQELAIVPDILPELRECLLPSVWTVNWAIEPRQITRKRERACVQLLKDNEGDIFLLDDTKLLSPRAMKKRRMEQAKPGLGRCITGPELDTVEGHREHILQVIRPDVTNHSDERLVHGRVGKEDESLVSVQS
jgi:hypothetical protein